MDTQNPETNGEIKRTKTQINSHTHTHKKKRNKKEERKGELRQKQVIRPINKPINEIKH